MSDQAAAVRRRLQPSAVDDGIFEKPRLSARTLRHQISGMGVVRQFDLRAKIPVWDEDIAVLIGATRPNRILPKASLRPRGSAITAELLQALRPAK